MHRPPLQSHLTTMPAPMLVFDGDCGFCHRAVQFILAHERRTDLLFVPRSSALGLSLREQYHLQNVESLLWIDNDRAFIEWQAVAHTAAKQKTAYEILLGRGAYRGIRGRNLRSHGFGRRTAACRAA